MPHTERQNVFWTKNANNIFFIQNLKYNGYTMIDVHLCIVKLESGGQQLPVIKKNRSENITLKKSY